MLLKLIETVGYIRKCNVKTPRANSFISLNTNNHNLTILHDNFHQILKKTMMIVNKWYD